MAAAMQLDSTEPQHAMLITIEEFRRRVANNPTDLITRLQEETGRYGGEEAQAWESSLTKLSRAFEAVSFQPLHLFFGSRGNLALSKIAGRSAANENQR
jgi:hypothetical protein